MKKSMGLLVGIVLASTTLVTAGEHRSFWGTRLLGPSLYFTADAPPAPVGVAPKAAPAPVPDGAAVALYPCVKYEDLRNIAPCAVPIIVQVADPCPPTCRNACDPCNTCTPCKPRCVSVRICVPPQGPCSSPPKVTCRRNGRYVRYDYGKYAVDIRVKNGYVVVDYDD